MISWKNYHVINDLMIRDEELKRLIDAAREITETG